MLEYFFINMLSVCFASKYICFFFLYRNFKNCIKNILNRKSHLQDSGKKENALKKVFCFHSC